MLDGIVRLLSDASGVHACFVYFVEDDGERLALRAASEPYSELIGTIALERGEGLAWWVLEHREPAFIRENLLDDPRVKYVPELEEERFQSLISVPILARHGDPIGVISMHTEAPREFTEEEVEFLVSSAFLVAGAIENARLYAEMRRRVTELEQLTALGEAIARAETHDELLPAVAGRTLALLNARSCALYLLEPGREELDLVASAPPDGTAAATLALGEIGPELSRRRREVKVSVPLVAAEELLGVLQADGTAEIDLARAVASQTAVALKKIELIERLTEKNLIKDFFEQLAGGRALGSLAERADRLGCDLGAPYVVVAASPVDDVLEQELARAAPGSLFDRRDDSMRGLLRVPTGGEGKLAESVQRVHASLRTPVSIGISQVCQGVATFPAGFEEARHALLGTMVLQGKPGVMTYDELGPYKYLLRMALDGDVRDSYRDALTSLAEYDRTRSTSLLPTLEEFLRRHGNISATAEALYVHPNTLRQRLARILELTGLNLRKDDWLMIEIALKMVKLRRALGPAPGDTSLTERL